MSKQKRKSLEEKLAILKEAETSGAVETIRKYGISYQTFYNWKNRVSIGGASSLAGTTPVPNAEMKRLQKENLMLKELVAEKELYIKILAALLKKK
jgi:putative transposase